MSSIIKGRYVNICLYFMAALLAQFLMGESVDG
jgi:hypothetical protein